MLIVPDLARVVPGVPSVHPVARYLLSLAPASRRAQRDALRTFAGFLGLDSIPAIDWSRIDATAVLAFRAWASEHRAPATVTRYLAAVRRCAREAHADEIMTRRQWESIAAIPSPRGSRLRAGRAVTHNALAALAAVRAGAYQRETVLRAQAALGLLYGAGLRRAEACAVPVEALDAGELRIVGKGNVERLIPIGMVARKLAAAWLELRGRDPGPLLCHLHHRAEQVHPSVVWRWMRLLARRAGVRPFSPHDLRRTYIGDLLDAGADLPTVQGLVGHASPTTTASYDRRPAATARAAVARLDVAPWVGCA